MRSSAIFLVSVVTRTRSSFSTRERISCTRSSIWPSVGLTTTSGSTRPVGRMICSTTPSERESSYWPGVAERYTAWPMRFWNSSHFSGRLSRAEGSRKPWSTRVRLREASPSYMAPICGTVTCDSSMTRRKSSGK
ncbi:hypothetical protein SHIRM173S_05740 [Streptomyces hirsutus]